MSTKRLIDLLIDFIQASENNALLYWYQEHPGLEEAQDDISVDIFDSTEYQRGYADALRQGSQRILGYLRQYADLFDNQNAAG